MCRFAPAPLAAEDDERATHLLKRRLHVVECGMVKGHVAYHYLVAIGDRGNQQQVALGERCEMRMRRTAGDYDCRWTDEVRRKNELRT